MDATTEQPVNPGRLEATIHDTGGDDHAARTVVPLASTTSILSLSADACRPDQHVGSEAARLRVGASGQLRTAR
jgi:hypothetical protein